MANNRIYLKCALCEPEKVMELARYYPVGWYTHLENTDFLNKFLGDHTHPEAVKCGDYGTVGQGRLPFILVHDGEDVEDDD